MLMDEEKIRFIREAIERSSVSMLTTFQSFNIKSVRRVECNDEIVELIAQPQFIAIEQIGKTCLIVEIDLSKIEKEVGND